MLRNEEDQYEIKEVVQMSPLGKLLLTIHQFIIAPFFIGSSAVIGIGAGLYIQFLFFRKELLFNIIHF